MAVRSWPKRLKNQDLKALGSDVRKIGGMRLMVRGMGELL